MGLRGAWAALVSGLGADKGAPHSDPLRLPLFQQQDQQDMQTHIQAAHAPNAEASTRADTSSVEGLTQAPRLTGLMSHPGRSVPAVPNPLTALAGEDAKDSIRYRGPLWTPDRGAGFYQTQRERQQSPSLISTGRHAGKSRVKQVGIEGTALGYHVWKRDFFTSVINQKLPTIIGVTVAVYIVSFTFWAAIWYAVWRFRPDCVVGCDGFVSAFVFAVATQQTIGYGDVSPGSCWLANWAVVTQSIFALLLNATVMGVIFARISRPSQRGRTIFLSDCAVIARRDGALRFMFRCADIRPSHTVISPRIRAFLYTFAERVTSEGEHIPVRVEELEVTFSDGLMLLPVTVEHTIDEKSPLYGHNHETLMALGAEIVAVFEGSSEHGGVFQARQSYLAREIHWGFQFRPITRAAPQGRTQHEVDISRFHEIEPQMDVMELLKPAQLARKVLAAPRGAVPYPLLRENTLVLSDQLMLVRRAGRLELQARVADVYPNQMLDVRVRMYLYRWKARGTEDTVDSSCEVYHMHELDLGRERGADRLCLRLPSTVSHVVGPDSPLAHWEEPSGVLHDADSEIVVVVESIAYATGDPMLRQRTYSVLSDVKVGSAFASMVSPPSANPDGKPHITWSRFHKFVASPSPRASGSSTPRGGIRRPPQQPRGGASGSSGAAGAASKSGEEWRPSGSRLAIASQQSAERPAPTAEPMLRPQLAEEKVLQHPSSPSDLSAAVLKRHNNASQGEATGSAARDVGAARLGGPQVGPMRSTFSDWLDTAHLSGAGAQSPDHLPVQLQTSGGLAAGPQVEDAVARVRSEMGSRSGYTAALAQMHAEMQRYALDASSAPPARSTSEDMANSSVPISHGEDWQATRALRDVLWANTEDDPK